MSEKSKGPEGRGGKPHCHSTRAEPVLRSGSTGQMSIADEISLGERDARLTFSLFWPTLFPKNALTSAHLVIRL